VATTLFLGGWQAPWPLSTIAGGMLNTGWWTPLWFLVKLWLCMFLFVWIRGTVVRFRYDQFMRLGWKRLLPLALTWIVILTAVKAVDEFTAVTFRPVLYPLLSVFAVLFIIMWYWPDERRKAAIAAEQAKVEPLLDPFAGGFPVPPLPGQTLPVAAAPVVEAVAVEQAVAVEVLDEAAPEPDPGDGADSKEDQA
jgi:NADH-quinone oxidoreductase subunit H